MDNTVLLQQMNSLPASREPQWQHHNRPFPFQSVKRTSLESNKHDDTVNIVTVTSMVFL